MSLRLMRCKNCAIRATSVECKEIRSRAGFGQASVYAQHIHEHRNFRERIVSYKLIDANGSYQSVKNEQYESDYILEDSFSGEFSEESYNEAIAEAKQVGLYDDFDIKIVISTIINVLKRKDIEVAPTGMFLDEERRNKQL